MPKNNTRQRRIGQLLREQLTLLLCNNVADPLLQKVVITAVHASSDLSVAKVYISDMCDDIDARLLHCQKAASFLRYQLAQRVDLRTVPVLQFVADKSLSHGNMMTELINKACQEDEKHKQGDVDEHNDTADES